MGSLYLVTRLPRRLRTRVLRLRHGYTLPLYTILHCPRHRSLRLIHTAYHHTFATLPHLPHHLVTLHRTTTRYCYYVYLPDIVGRCSYVVVTEVTRLICSDSRFIPRSPVFYVDPTLRYVTHTLHSTFYVTL